MKYEQVQNLPDESFRRLTGVKRQTFEKMVKYQGSRTNSANSIDSGQNGSTEKLIGDGQAGARAQARDCSFERSLMMKIILERGNIF